MTPARRARCIAKFDGHCARLGCAVTTGLEIDHIIALELAGKDDDSNLQPLCDPHHKVKTALDIKLIAKSRRLRKKADPATRKPAQMQSRGFDRTLRKKMDGTVERRP